MRKTVHRFRKNRFLSMRRNRECYLLIREIRGRLLNTGDRRERIAAAVAGGMFIMLWGPGSWGRTDLSPRSSEFNRPAGLLDRQGSVLDFPPLVREILCLMHCRGSAKLRRILSKSAASSNGSTHQRATALSSLIMAGRMFCCT